MRVLLVEDDRELAEYVGKGLEEKATLFKCVLMARRA
jgi:DNA-binding response OmpR family regulator